MRNLIADIHSIHATSSSDAAIVTRVAQRLTTSGDERRRVLAHYRRVAANSYAQNLVYVAPDRRFSIVALTWGPSGLSAAWLGGTPAEVARAVRRLVREAKYAGCCRQQRRFMRHAAPLWEIHRHRAPKSTLDARDRLIATGRLTVHRGRLVELDSDAAGFRATYAVPGAARRLAELRAEIIVDCTGPRRDIAARGDELVESLLARGLAHAATLGIGFAAAADGSLTASVSRAPIFALGTPLRGTFAETSAVREIRCQAQPVARALVSSLMTALPEAYGASN